MQETWVWSLGGEDPLEKGMATHSSILAWRIPWTEEPGGLQSMGSQRVRTIWATNIHTHILRFSEVKQFTWDHTADKVKWKCLSRVLLFEIPWTIHSMNTGVGSLSLLQGIFPNQGSKPDLLHCRQILYQLSHKGSPADKGQSLNLNLLIPDSSCSRHYILPPDAYSSKLEL